jgi:hypothetical protein
VGCIVRGLGCLPLVWGLLFLMGGFVFAIALAIPSNWQRTQGTYTSVETVFTLPTSQGVATSYIARVSFTANGETFSVSSAGQAVGNPPAVGDHVEVAFSPTDPRTARALDDSQPPAATAWIFFGVGGTVALIGLVWLLVGPIRIFTALRRRFGGRREG